MLRDGIRKGQLGWGKALFAVGLVALEYLIAMPAVLLHDKHPEYKPLFIGAMVLVVANLIAFIWIAWRWRSRPSGD